MKKPIQVCVIAGETACATKSFQGLVRLGGAGIQPAEGFFNKLLDHPRGSYELDLPLVGVNGAGHLVIAYD